MDSDCLPEVGVPAKICSRKNAPGRLACSMCEPGRESRSRDLGCFPSDANGQVWGFSRPSSYSVWTHRAQQSHYSDSDGLCHGNSQRKEAHKGGVWAGAHVGPLWSSPSGAVNSSGMCPQAQDSANSETHPSVGAKRSSWGSATWRWLIACVADLSL